MNNIRVKAIKLTTSSFAPYMLGAALFLLLVSYIYLANTAVRNVTRLENSKGIVQNLRMKVSELEANQFIAQNTINKNTASHLGLVEVTNPTYILRTSSENNLSMSR